MKNKLKVTLNADAYINDGFLQISLIPNISLMKYYHGFAIIFDWLCWYFEIRFEYEED